MKKGKTSLQQFFYQILEFLGILKVVLDIGNEKLRLLEVIRFLWFKQVLLIESEQLLDTSRIGFMIERFLEKYASHQVRRIYLTLSSVSVIPMFLPLPGIPKDKISSVIKWQVDKLVPLTPTEVYTGFQVLSKIEDLEIETAGWNVMAISARKSEINPILETLANLGIIVQSIQYAPFQFLKLFLTTPQPTAEGLILSTTNTTFLMIIHLGHIVHFSQVMDPIEPPTEIKLKNIVKFFTEFIRRGGSFLSKISLMGEIDTESQMELVQILMESLNIIVVPVTRKDLDPVVSFSSLSFQDLDLSAIFVKKKILPTILLPVNQKERIRDLFFRTTILLLIFFNLISILILPMVFQSFRNHKVYHLAKIKKITELKSTKSIQIAETLQKIQKLHEYEEQQQSLIEKIEKLKKQGITSSNIKMILAEISKLIPDTVWLTDLSIQKNNGILKGKSSSTSGLEDFIVKLVNSPFLNNVVLKKADMKKISGTKMIHFTILFEVNL